MEKRMIETSYTEEDQKIEGSGGKLLQRGFPTVDRNGIITEAAKHRLQKAALNGIVVCN